MNPEPQGGWLAVGEPVTLENCEREAIHLPGRVQAHGAMLVVDAEAPHAVLQTSQNIAEVLGGSGPDALLGRALAKAVGADAAAVLVGLPVTGPPALRPELLEVGDDRAVMAQCFRPAPGLIGIELEAAPSQLPAASTMTRYASRVASQLSTAADELACVGVAVQLLKETTGFDRVWAYRFEEDGHGVVVAEERADQLMPFVGLHFPETDIPVQARTMYLEAGVRLIGDTDRDDVPLVPELNPNTGERTDLSGSDLRGVSPMHVRYLRNMGVRTSMSVPIVIDGALWGLLSAHHYERAHPVSVLTRGQCETLGLLTAMQLAAVGRSRASADEASAQRHLRELAAQLGGAPTATDGLIARPDELLQICGADGVVVSLGDGEHVFGTAPDPAGVTTLLGALGEHADDDVVVTSDLRGLDPQLAGLAPDVAGVLAICLSRQHRHWVVWTRQEQIEHITWANRSRELVRRDPEGSLELGARESFERWAETVDGRSAPWNDAQVDAAREVRAAIGAYAFQQALQVSERASELARVNEELDAFAYSAAHDLRQPVRAIAMRNEFLLEDLADRLSPGEQESMQAIGRLTGHMGSLVDSLLQYAKLDYAAHQTERVHLTEVLRDVRELLGGAADHARITLDDAFVEADPDTLRQVLFNLVWNAVKYTERPPVLHIGATTLSRLDPAARGPVRIPDDAETDPDVVFVRDNGIGIDPGHLETIFGLFRRLHTTDEYGGGSGAGLALSRRLVQRSGGSIWATSTLGEGSTFYFTTGEVRRSAA